MTCVLDASFALRATSSTAPESFDAMMVGLAEEGLLAPAIFWHEVGSGLRNMMLKAAVKASARALVFERLRALDIAVEATSSRLEPVIQASDRFQLTVYDAAYLELAMRTGSSLATRDRSLRAAAPRAGVPLVLA